MDLLQGYGSDDSSNSSVANAPSRPAAPATATSAPPSKPTHPPSTATTARVTKKRGKRLLSLQAVLPPEILDRLTRPEGQDSSEDEDIPRKRSGEVQRGNHVGDRSGMNSLLDELRSAPLHQRLGNKQAGLKESISKDATTKKREDSEGLGMAFMSYTTQSVTKSNNGQVVDVHAKTNSSSPEARLNSEKTHDVERKTAETKKATSTPFARMSAAAPIPKSMQHSLTAIALPSAYPASAPPEIDAPTPAARYAPSFSPKESNADTTNNSNHNPFIKSRKQKRQEERALRTGTAFHQNDVSSSSAMEIHQPSPTEYAPTAHMAAIASRAAHLRGLGSIDPQDTSNYGEYASEKKKSLGVAMYDPKTGTDVRAGVTAKHKSKHQINQLMVNALGLEATRAGEAELARLGLGRGTGGGGGRTDAKRKYGW